MTNPKQFFLESKNIAVVRTDKIGDMVLTLPMFKAIKSKFPDKKLTLIASDYTKALLENCEYIDQTFFLEDFKDGIDDIFKKEKFDVIFFPRPRFKECLSAFRTRQKLRIGTAYRWYSFLFNYRIYVHRKIAEKHEAEYNVNMIENLTGNKLKTELVRPFITNIRRKKIEDLLNEYQLEQNNFIIIHPGSGGSAYEWGPENFGNLAKSIYHNTGIKAIITGNQSDVEKCDIVNRISETSINLCSKLALSELIALISYSGLLIANSTGVIHIAAAFEKKVIGLYPNTPYLSPKRWGPYSKNSICITPDYSDEKNRDKMNLIDFQKVFETTLEMLKK